MKILTIHFQKEPKILTLWHYQQLFSHLLDIGVKRRYGQMLEEEVLPWVILRILNQI